MSITRDIIADSIADRESIFGDAVVNTRTGRKFTIEIQPIAEMELNEALGRDPREAVTFHIRDKVAASEIIVNDEIVVTGIGKFTITRRSDNPISNQVEFGAAKKLDKDQ